MRIKINLLLIMSVALVCCSSQAKISSATSLEVPDTDYRRFLRAATTDEPFFSSLVLWVQTHWWLLNEKTVEDVQKILGLEGLSGAALKASERYKQLKHFKYTLEGWQLERKLSKGVTSHQIWRSMRLDKISPDQRETSDAFKTYKRYIELEDDKFFQMWDKGGSISFGKDDGKAEVAVKAKMWLFRKRPLSYAGKMLNIDMRSYQSILLSENFDLYEPFVRRQSEDTWTRYMKFRESPGYPIIKQIKQKRTADSTYARNQQALLGN